MAEVMKPPSQLPAGTSGLSERPIKISPPLQNQTPNENAILSPVNQNGSFEFDRVIKSGEVLKRTRKTKAWKPIHIVLRPNLLSIYKDKDQTKLRHRLTLSDLTAVARQKDPKRKAQHVFGVFSPSRNFHFEAQSESDAQDWVQVIRREAHIDEEEEEETTIMSPGGAQDTHHGFERHGIARRDMVSSSSEAEQRPSSTFGRENQKPRLTRRISNTLMYSGNEQGSFSDFSDTNAFRESTLSLSNQNAAADTIYRGSRPTAPRNASQMSGVGIAPDDERVVFHGWLYILKSKRGVRQWKKVWVVLRPKCLALYKNSEEYSASLIIPFPSILNTVEIDPISKSKRYCMQIISEERNYRFCAPDEDALARWLGAFMSLLAKRKEVGLQRNNAANVATSEQQG